MMTHIPYKCADTLRFLAGVEAENNIINNYAQSAKAYETRDRVARGFRIAFQSLAIDSVVRHPRLMLGKVVHLFLSVQDPRQN